MRIAYIHDDKKINTGAHHINNLMVNKLREHGVIVKNVYPRTDLIDTSRVNLRGVANILFFYSLLEQKKEILKYDLIQGTTYTPITFLPFDIPVVTHFGSTTQGFLQSVPKTKYIEKELLDIWHTLKQDKIIPELDIKTRKPLMDIADIEFFAASKSNKVIATSKIVKNDLIKYGQVPAYKICIIHNAIEDYWFDTPLAELNKPKLIFLGRIGNDVFTWRLKGVDRLIKIYQEFPGLEKVSIVMTINKKIGSWLNSHIPNHKYLFNFPKDKIRKILHPHRGSIFLLTSRYEGFSLSLVEAMSQGLIPVVFPVGVAPEIIINGKNGFLVKNTQEAYVRIKEILNNDELRANMSTAAYLTSLKFRADILAKKLVFLYEQVVEKSDNLGLDKFVVPNENLLITEIVQNKPKLILKSIN
ncbi:MAG: glycosyltransferase family 4 protein [Patescibacteria group bacterium]|nr:glycosyltransferase family 4 protein [Patescibacteria group bacterium]